MDLAYSKTAKQCLEEISGESHVKKCSLQYLIVGCFGCISQEKIQTFGIKYLVSIFYVTFKIPKLERHNTPVREALQLIP